MKVTGVIKDVDHDYVNDITEITFIVNESVDVLEHYEKYKGQKLNLEYKFHRNKRSVDANSYLWSLLQKMGDVLHKSKDNCYLDMLGEYGEFTHIIVKPQVVDKMKREWDCLRVLGEVEVNGIKGIQLQCYFGSSTYDSKQMSTLLNGVINECKDLGIETLSDDEVLRMKEQWGV